VKETAECLHFNILALESTIYNHQKTLLVKTNPRNKTVGQREVIYVNITNKPKTVMSLLFDIVKVDILFQVVFDNPCLLRLR